MLISALVLTLCWLVVSSLVLLAVGRHLGGPSPLASLLLVLFIEAVGGYIAASFGVSRAEALGYALPSLLLAVLVIRAFPDWNPAGHAAWLFALEAGCAYLLVAAVFALLIPVGVVALLLGLVLLAMQAAGTLLALSYAYELLDVVCRRRWRRPEGRPPRLIRTNPVSPSPPAAGAPLEFARDQMPLRVALHVPCHDEPPALVQRTLAALAQLDYPRDAFQVFVVDNNTSDPDLWEPLAATCERLGFAFLHLEDWPGYKSGALNYALAATPTEFDLIGVVDADYLVSPDYLRDIVGYFSDPSVAFVQTPQDYRDYRPDSTFYQRACYHAYRYFFDLSMPSRNERNAIIFGGTMGLIRADALRHIGGWDEWCITEDAEASLRLLSRGYTGIYVNRAYGRGLMPLEFDALKRQRFRWCFGGIQILRKHWAALLPWAWRPRSADRWEAPGLTLAQRYHYLLGGLQWYSDVLTFGFTILLLVTGGLTLIGRPLRLPVLGGPLLMLPLSFWVMSLLRTLWGLRATRRCTWGEALGAIGILWGLGWVVTLACLQGLVRRRGVFLRTPKAGRASLLRVLRSTTAETALGAACWGVGIGLLASSGLDALAHGTGGSPLRIFAALRAMPVWLWGTSTIILGLLAILQGTTYLTAPILCLLSLRGESAAREVRRRALGADPGEGTPERRLLVGALVAVAALGVLMIATATLPQQSGANSSRLHALTTLLGGSNPVASPTTLGTPPPGQSATPLGGGGTPTTTASTSSTATPGPSPTPTDTPHPGGTPSASPGRTPTPHPTPPPHP